MESATEYVTEKDETVIEVVDGIEAEMCSQYEETKSKGDETEEETMREVIGDVGTKGIPMKQGCLNENDNNEGNTYGTGVEKNSNRN
ncbi:hypothetical protein Tco_0395741, partial [Tanacetum coccineum]